MARPQAKRKNKLQNLAPKIIEYDMNSSVYRPETEGSCKRYMPVIETPMVVVRQTSLRWRKV